MTSSYGFDRDTPRPQDTGCTTLEAPNEGVLNGILSSVTRFRDVEYDEEADVYKVK